LIDWLTRKDFIYLVTYQYLFTVCYAYEQKELGDRKSASIDFVRQLLPLPKMFCEVIMSEYVGHSGSSDARGGGSTHKANNDAEQRKQVSVDF